VAPADLRGVPDAGFVVFRQFVGPPSVVFSFGSAFVSEGFSFAIVFGAALIMARIEGRSPGVYGLPLRGAFGKLFWQGCLIGLIEISILIGLIAAFGAYSFGGLALHGKELLRWGMLWAVFFIFVGLFEEFLFRAIRNIRLRTASVSGPRRSCSPACLVPCTWGIPAKAGWEQQAL